MLRNNWCLIFSAIYITASWTRANPSTCDFGNCGLDKQPICGSDSVTYENVCQLMKRRCEWNPDLVVYHSGECLSTDTDERRDAHCIYNCVVNDPVCGTDGRTYGSTEMSTRMSLEMPRPWRKTLDWSDTNKVSEELYNNLENYSPISDSINGIYVTSVANILLFGPVGAGKSSFVNTVASVFRRKMTLQTRCGNAARSLTTKLKKYRITSDSGKNLNFTLNDIMGLEKDHPVTETNMQLLLEGALKDNSHYDFSSKLSEYRRGFNNSRTLDNKIHCVAIFVDATVVECMTESMPEVVQNIKDLQTLMNRLDVPQVIILTKIDNVCAETKDDLSFVYRSERVKECVSRVSDILGLPRNAIFPVKNYEDEGQLSSDVNILTMYTLTKILEQVDAALLNRIEERKNRNTGENDFMNVINYIIDLFRWIWPSR